MPKTIIKKQAVVKKIPVFSFAEGKELNSIAIPEFLKIEASKQLVYQVLNAYETSLLQPSHTKARGEVRGGGRKPYRQKGTGRARQGSIRAPHFIGGGVTFGPKKNENKLKLVSKKMKRKAILGLIADKIKSKAVLIIDNIELTQPKTKEANTKLSKIVPKGRLLLILAIAEINNIKAFRNIALFKYTKTSGINIYDLFLAKTIIITKAALAELEKNLIKVKK